MVMNAPHWHLVLNHFPVVGFLLVVLLLAYALLRGRGELYGVALSALVLLALVNVAVFFTGRGADEALMELPDVNDKLIHVHEQAASFALGGTSNVGAVALLGLWLGRKQPHVSRGMATLVFALALFVSTILARTAYLGGQIRHPEIRPAGSSAESAPAKSGHD